MNIKLQDPGLLKTQAYINGQWVDADNGATFAVTNPATGEHLADVASLGAVETRRAIEAAEVAMQAWKAEPASVWAAAWMRTRPTGR
jgi:succinate-semialdehyde dehydrogenase/glutarate-semialdehyde dehydrogenase